ncbi:glucose-6-phosphate dehydrogenase [Botrimarina mediterranea]|uniref:Glucose-6-phosphate 1-dehydrogenase n=1 Tax=Botrimarina mediterranea TaxID=2528022 RepID=A0A518KA30_9BACT|nr:glucose-6-phosphate dehydrogenase [Botrimarina mediterranea]QDV74640.1 Glucose-6-phosphate 1-dehydrogenase [Botrimarina mediterranea]QDV79277.1 Glucose-6-phosphate 1-dehydrogenase [Planctomycetes bacterium K2D]
MPHTIVIFGASGDLTSRKLIPALYNLKRKKRLPEDARIVGFSRTAFSHDEWRKDLRATTQEFAGDKFKPEVWDEFAKQVFYHAGDIGDQADFVALGKFLGELEGGQNASRVYYLSTAPRFYGQAVEQLGKAGLACEDGGCDRRVVIEKPFGIDLASAKALNNTVHAHFKEHQVYRIDHYLGKETVQNLFVLRFANAIFEPIWNRQYIDHVQITVAEEVNVGSRAGYYDSAGVVRDMIQNHLLQLLMVTAMEPPARYAADPVRDEKVKVLLAVRPKTPKDIARDTVRAQYDGYLKAEGVPENSKTATFAAIKLGIDNWRWQGVPFYLRSGKAMSCRTTQIVIQFRQPPHMLFKEGPKTIRDANRLIIQVQPAEGIQMHFQTKVPDAGMTMRQTDLDFNYQKNFGGSIPEAYERLLLDAIEGDASLFARADEVEAAWGICDPILNTWAATDQPKLLTYEPGGWGPVECTEWMAAQRREWFDACPVLH